MKSAFNPPPFRIYYYVFVVGFLTASCDQFEKDVIPRENVVKINQHDFYIIPNASAVFDLKSLVSANEEVSVSITKNPVKGSLSKLTESIYKFDPGNNFTSGRDQFTVSFSRNGSWLKTDTIFINVEQDTTSFPCELYAVEDSAFTGVDQPVVIPVLQNDRVCNIPRHSLKKEIYVQPSNGQAEVVGDSIKYTPDTGYSGSDHFIYRISAPGDTIASLGLVNIFVGDIPCDIQLNDNYFVFLVAAHSTGAFAFDVLHDDRICSTDTAQASVAIVNQASYGTIEELKFGTFRYVLSSPITHTITDSLIYEYCYAGECYQANFTLVFQYHACDLNAVNDTLDLRDSLTTGIIYIPILNNDQLCGGIDSLKFTDGPYHGTLYSYKDKLGYLPDAEDVENDSITYEVCKEPPLCSSAKVYILRK